ncbi:DUF1330 domain-containing protein [Tabrizicola aquatica]|uniref:DUF1330 domain-containing protein n=1 Tax=Tabrizicola aquatica TaxID=909926 RepID=UPI000CD12C06|nr:DUF1330 domain-containing protein [Tabrizicola aquatica]
MTVTVLALTTPRPGGEMALQSYLDVVGPLMQAAGARLVSRHSVADTLAGTIPARFVSIMEYPSEAALRQVFESPAYLALEQIKATAFSQYQVSVLDRFA